MKRKRTAATSGTGIGWPFFAVHPPSGWRVADDPERLAAYEGRLGKVKVRDGRVTVYQVATLAA